MSVPPRPPLWAEIEEFCTVDDWREVRVTGHRYFEKVLDSGEVLQTHTSLDRQGTMSQSRFSLILRTQLRVSRREFWTALETGDPVARPVPDEEPQPPSHEAWVLRVLQHELHLSAAEIARLSVDEGIQRVHEHWSS
jgi:hypothetical protein